MGFVGKGIHLLTGLSALPMNRALPELAVDDGSILLAYIYGLESIFLLVVVLLEWQ